MKGLLLDALALISARCVYIGVYFAKNEKDSAYSLPLSFLPCSLIMNIKVVERHALNFKI